MVNNCVAVGCNNYPSRYTKVSFYRFPCDVERRNKWIAAVKRKSWKPSENSRLCSEHFISGYILSRSFIKTLTRGKNP
jgi:hypothetical protein